MKVLQLFLLFVVVYLASAASTAVKDVPEEDVPEEDEEYDGDEEYEGEEDTVATNEIVAPSRPEIAPVKPVNPCQIFHHEFKPVCGANGVTYGNIYIFECENNRRQQAGEPLLELRCFNACCNCLKVSKPEPESSCVCDKKYEPVCANNGVTFNNMCGFNCENDNRLATGQRPLKIRCHKPCYDATCYAILKPAPFKPL